MIIDSNQYAKTLKIENEALFCKSNLPFLLEHRGLRPKKMHIILSSSGAGKSTLIRTMMIDYLMNNEGRILLWLSEETDEDFLTNLAYSSKHFSEVMDRVTIFSEISDSTNELLKKKSGKRHELLFQLFSKIKDRNYGLVIFDNITTSGLYTQDINIQPDVIRNMKEVVKFMTCPFLVVAHTAKNDQIKKPMFDDDSIKGSNVPTQIAEYSYMLNTLQYQNRKETFLRVSKSRSHSIDHSLFCLRYSKDSKLYSEIIPIEYEVYAELFKKVKIK